MSGSVDSMSETRTHPVIQRISPRIIPGVLTSSNKGAFDWGWQSFIAYGCHNHVVVIDTQNVRIFQTLEKHKGDVIKVKWAKESYYHDLTKPYTLKLASADNNGVIIVWDVKEAKVLSTFYDGVKPVQEMEWLNQNDSLENMLVALHPPYSIILWNTATGTKIWKKSYTETLISFAFDPFRHNRLTFLASDCILFVDDFSLSKAPSSNGRKFYIANPSANQQSSSSSSSADDRTWPINRNIIPKRIRFLVREDSKSVVDGVTLNDCMQLTYHKSYSDHLLLLYPREILVLDLEINQTVGIVSMDHSGSPIAQLYSCWQRDAFYILHENGCITFRLRHQGHKVMAAATPSYSVESFDTQLTEQNLEVVYDQCCQSDSLRFTKHAKIVGLAVCPKTEKRVSLLISDGRLLILDLFISKKERSVPTCWAPHLSTYIPRIEDSIETSTSIPGSSSFPYLKRKVVHPGDSLSDCIGPALYPGRELSQSFKDTFNFKLFITGSLCAVAAPPHVIRMCPPVTFRNWKSYQPLMAIGNGGGTIQVINMATGIMTKEFCVHTSPVRGIEWIGLTSFMSFAHSNTANSSGHVRNELVLTDINAGRTKSLRADRQEESPIEMLRVSHLRQYVIIVFKEEPFELWDLRLLTLLRIMSKNQSFPNITAMEWSPVHKKQQSTLDFSLDKLKENIINAECSDIEKVSKSVSYTKEYFVFTDTNGQLNHFSVEGNIIKDGSTIPPDAVMGCITCIAWKGDVLVLGDVDGNLNVLDLKSGISKGAPTHRGVIKKVRFGPGKGNMKIIILTSEGVDLWDMKEVVRVQSVRCPKDMPKVQDVDWVGSDKPCIATADGSIRILDIDLKQTTSPIYEYQPSDTPFSPHLLAPEVAFYFKSYLHHLISSQKFNADVDHQDNYSMLLAEKQLESLENNIKTFIADCPFGTAERALHIARLFGDEEACRFWTVALYYMKVAKLELMKHSVGQNLLQKEDDKEKDEEKDQSSPYLSKRYAQLFFDQPLDTGFDILCDNQTFKRLQLDRVALHMHKRTTHNQTQQCAERLLLLGQTEKAVTLLLETDSSNSNFYTDCLRACLAATVQSSGTSQSIIKLVSTNLIASGRVMEGVQLLCLIEKGMDACRYLLGAGKWQEAVWLAKSTLPMNECQEILKRWVDHLSSPVVDKKNKALLVLLTTGQFWKAIQLMSKMTERAALFLQACMEFGLVTRNDENSIEIDSIFLEYSEYLLSIKNRTSSIHYCALFSMSGDESSNSEVVKNS